MRNTKTTIVSIFCLIVFAMAQNAESQVLKGYNEINIPISNKGNYVDSNNQIIEKEEEEGNCVKDIEIITDSEVCINSRHSVTFEYVTYDNEACYCDARELFLENGEMSGGDVIWKSGDILKIKVVKDCDIDPNTDYGTKAHHNNEDNFTVEDYTEFIFTNDDVENRNDLSISADTVMPFYPIDEPLRVELNSGIEAESKNGTSQQVTYEWYYKFNDDENYQLSETTSKTSDEHRALPEDAFGAPEFELEDIPEDVYRVRFKVKVSAGYCDGDHSIQKVSGWFHFKSAFDEDDISVNTGPPECPGEDNASLEITGIEDPDEDPNYDYYDRVADFPEARDTFNFTVTELKEVSSDTDECTNSWADETDEPIGIGVDGYRIKVCPVSTSHKKLHYDDFNGEVVLSEYDEINISSEIYEFAVANDLKYSSFKNYKKIQNPDSLKLTSIDYKEYVYDTDTFHFESPDSVVKVEIGAEGGNDIDKYKLISEDNNIVESSNNILTVSNPGTYKVSIIDEYQCDFTIDINSENLDENDTTITLNAPEPLDVDSTVVSPISCNINNDSDEPDTHSDGKFSVENIQGGIGPYTLCLKHNGDTICDETDEDNLYNASIESLPYGDYHFTLEDRFNDTLHIDTKIPQPDPLDLNIDAVKPPECLGGNTGAITLADLQGGHINQDNDYQIFYKNADEDEYTQSSVNEQGENISIENLLGNEDYKIKMQDTEGCYQVFDVSMGENENPVKPEILNVQDPLCYGESSGEVLVTAKEGDPIDGDDYAFNILSQNEDSVRYGETAAIKHLEGNPDTYYVYVEDSNRCITESLGFVDTSDYVAEVTLQHPDPLTANLLDTLGVSETGAADGEVQFVFSGSNKQYEYWIIKEGEDDTISGISGEADTVLVDGLQQGDYDLYLRDTCGCTVNNDEYFESFQIDTPSVPLNISASEVKPVSCYGRQDGSVNLNSIGGWDEHEYLNGNDSDEGWTYDNQFTSLAPGDYTFYVRDSRNVLDSVLITIEEPDSLNVTTDTIIDTRCFNYTDGQIYLDISGGRSPYQYSIDNGGSWDSLSVTGEINGLGAGHYNITVRDSVYHCEDTITAEINEPEELSGSLETVDSRCGEPLGEIHADIVGGTEPYNYILVYENHDTLSGIASSADSLLSGSYELTILDEYGCELNFNEVSIGDTEAPEILEKQSEPVSCNGSNDGILQFSVEDNMPSKQSGYSIGVYNSTGDTVKYINDTTSGEFVFSSMLSGSYTIEVIDSLGCRSFENIEIGSKEPLELEIEKDNPTCFGGSDGKVDLNASGGNGTYHYNWADGFTGKFREELESGNYLVTITDTLGCEKEFDVLIEDPDKLEVDLGGDAIICGGMVYELNPGGFDTYLWEKNEEEYSRDSSVQLDEEGVYALEVTDEKGCVARDSFRLEVDNNLLYADFLIPTEAEAGDTIVAVDISHPQPDSIMWKFEGSPEILFEGSPGSVPYTRFIQYSDTGSYDVKLLSLKAQCRDSIVKTVYINPGGEDSTHVKSIEDKNDFIRDLTVYPNPTDGTFKVDVELEEKENIIIEIFDTNRNMVIDRRKFNGLKDYSVNYRLNRIVSGIYILRVKTKYEQDAVRIIIP